MMRRRDVLRALGTAAVATGSFTQVSAAEYSVSDPADYYASAFGERNSSEYAWKGNGAAPGGRKATVWVHGWDAGGIVGTGSISPAIEEYKHASFADMAFDAIVNEAGHSNTGDRIGFLWESASSKLGFDYAVENMWDTSTNFARFLIDVCEQYDEVHVGAQSLGGWLSLEGITAAYERHRQAAETHLGGSLVSIRMTNAAVPSSATGWDPDWTRFGTYDRALHLPDRVINGFYVNDEVLEGSGGIVDVPSLGPYGSSPFHAYLANYGSSSAALGWLPDTKHLCEADNVEWHDRQVCVEDHSNAYKHPDYADDAGGAQPVLWKNETCDGVYYGPRGGSIGRGSGSGSEGTSFDTFMSARMCREPKELTADRRDSGDDDDGRDRERTPRDRTGSRSR